MTDPNEDLMQPAKPGFRSGYAALVGRPNVGKSTLLNTILGQKLAIVSSKPQTTRHRILGIHTEPDSQIVFLDTPGIHKPKEALNKFMVDQAIGSMADGDVIVAIFSGDEKIGKGDEFVVERARQSGVPFIAVLNKIDLLKPNLLAERWEWLARITEGAAERIAISALKQAGIEALLKTIKTFLPEGPLFYPEDSITDRSERFILAELLREKIIWLTREELPYASTVRIDRMAEEEGKKALLVEATISVERETQKGMVIGKGGEMLKNIATQGRIEMEKFLGKHLFLEVRVEVRKNWRTNPKELQRLGYTDEVS